MTDLPAEAVEARATRLYPGTTDYPLSQVGADLTALVAENKRLRAVAEAARVLIPAGDGDSLTEYAITWAGLRAALYALDAGGEG